MTRYLAAICLLVVFTGTFVRAADSDVVITEILYNPNPVNTGGEFLEIQNTGTESVNVSGWVLTNAVDFTFPTNTTLDSGEIIVIARDSTAAQDFYSTPIFGEFLGALSNSGETIILRDDSFPRQVVDAVGYNDGSDPDGENTWPTEADGAGPSLELLHPGLDNASASSWGIGRFYSPGTPNSPLDSGGGDIVITEIMYQPLKKRFMENLDVRKGGYWWEDGSDPDGEYVEIYNAGTQTVDMTGWSFVDGIFYDFDNNFSLDPGEYVAVCANASAIAEHYGTANVVGDFTGVLDDGGEHVTLVDETNGVVDTVRFDDVRPWPIGPDQDGRSLELLDPLSPNDGPGNWRATRVPEPPNPDLELDEPEPGDWIFIDITDEATTGQPNGTHPFYAYCNATSEWLIDDLQIVPAGGGANLITNGTFETGDAGWEKTGSHSGSTWTDTDSREGSRSQRVVASSAGGSNTNSLHWPDVVGMVTGQSYRMTCWIKHRSGIGQLILRLSGGGLRVTTSPEDSNNNNNNNNNGLRSSQSPLTFLVGTETWVTRGTPGEPNTVSSDGLPPLAYEMAHEPLRPTSSNTVTITTHVRSSNPVMEVRLNYTVRDAPYNIVDESSSVLMRDDGVEDNGIAGDGVFGARIAAQPSQSLVRYRVEVTDTTGLGWTWPDEEEPNPNGAYFVYDGEEETNLPAYFLILPNESVQALNRNLSEFRGNVFTTKIKEYVTGSIVIDGIVYDNIRTRYRSDRTHAKKSYKIQFNKEEYFDGLSSLDTNYDWPVTEKVASNLFMLLGQSENIAMELMRFYTNGRFSGVFVAQESPNRSWLRRVGLDDSTEIYKSKSSDGCCSGFDPTFPNCPRGGGDFCASNLGWKSFYEVDHLPRMYIKRGDSLAPFTSLEDFIFGLRDNSGSRALNFINNNTKSYNWLYKSVVHSLQPHCDYHAKNFYIMRSPEGLWDVIFFDYDRFWGCLMFQGSTCHSVSESPKCSGTMFNSRVYGNSTLNSRFLNILEDAAQVLTPEVVGDMLDHYFDMTIADRAQERSQVSGSTVNTDSRLAGIKSHINSRRSWILNTYLPSRSRARPSNAHPEIELAEPVHAGKDLVKIEWTHSDTEGDEATVDLYWTDLGFSHLQAIPTATDLPAGNGGFDWTTEIPDLVSKPIYIHAVIDDGRGEFVGRSTSVSIDGQFFVDVPFRRGDVDGNGVLNISDDVNNLNYQFLGILEPSCLDALDVDDDGDIDLEDPLNSLFFQFGGGQAPPAPGHLSCGLDATPSPGLSCEAQASCAP